MHIPRLIPLLSFTLCSAAPAPNIAARYDIWEASFHSSRAYSNPYREVNAEAAVTRPDGTVARIPLFWDGGASFKLRLSLGTPGPWTFRITANDPALNSQSGRFQCVESGKAGGLRPSTTAPSHFERQNGQPVWCMADTAWGYFTDSPEDNHHRPQAEHCATLRASQGFNAIHSMLMSEQGVGNQNGPPFLQLSAGRLNPEYWREVDQRLAFANRQGLSVGLALAWGNKKNLEPFAWGRFPDLAARKRYARYIVARYSA